jgi:hypothetical protein
MKRLENPPRRLTVAGFLASIRRKDEKLWYLHPRMAVKIFKPSRSKDPIAFKKLHAINELRWIV